MLKVIYNITFEVIIMKFANTPKQKKTLDTDKKYNYIKFEHSKMPFGICRQIRPAQFGLRKNSLLSPFFYKNNLLFFDNSIAIRAYWFVCGIFY